MSNPDFIDDLGKVIAAAMVAKIIMQDSGTRQHEDACPKCGGRMLFGLAGRIGHIRAKCQNEACGLGFME